MVNDELSKDGRYTELLSALKAVEARAIRAEEALEDSRINFARAEQIASIGYWSWNLKTGQVYWSEGHFRIFGFRAGERQDYHNMFRERVHPEDIERVETLVKISTISNEPYSTDYRIIMPDGSLKHIHEGAHKPSLDEFGNRIKLFGIVQDITDRKIADEQIQASLKEKEALLKEIHHRVKNNLQIISSLLSLQGSFTSDERYKELLMDSQNRIRSMALLHELLYKSKDLSSINISEYIHSLTSYISRSYQHYSSQASLCIEVDDIRLDIEKAINVGIIVTELISNSIKYAFPGDRPGEIRVELHREGQEIVLTVSDNGVGLPQGLDIHNTPTLGLQLVEILAQQLCGTLEVETGDLTRFRIRFADRAIGP